MNEIENKAIYLCRCILSNIPIEPDKVNDIDLDSLYKFCQYHSITALIGYALESVGIKDSRFVQVKEKAIRKNMLLDVERKRIQKFLDKKQIWNMPLKGVVLKELYPKIGMRQMSDNDILFDAEKRSEVSDFMKKSGYHHKNEINVHCDEWVKEPMYNYEMHMNFFTEGSNPVFYNYYKDVFKKLVRINDKTYEYKFTDEDFYVYMTAHAYKHYSYGGSGVRTLIDYYVFLKAKSDTMDIDYVLDELDKLGLTEFEASMRKTSLHIFSGNADLTDEEASVLKFMSESGTYGNSVNKIKNTSKLLNANSKPQYIFRLIFPNVAYYKKWFPIAYKYPVLIPFVWVYRLSRGVFKRRDRVENDLRTVKKMDNDAFKK